MSRRVGRSWSERAYAALLWLYPAEFRRRFGAEIHEFFGDRLRDERARGGWRGVARLWTHTLPDLAATAFHEWRGALVAPRLTSPPPTSTRTGDGMLVSLARDLRFAGRMLRKSPVFTGVAAIVIALGVGAVSTIFSVANAIVLRPIPGVVQPGELATIHRTLPDGGETTLASFPYYRSLTEGSHTMRGIAAWSMVQLTVSTGGEGMTAAGTIVSGNYFDVLGVRPAVGRFFNEEESRVPGAYPVIVLSEGFWQRRFGGERALVGKSVIVNGAPFTVIGVTPAGFTGLFPVMRIDAWVPVMMQRQLRRGGRSGDDLLTQAGSGWLELVGRLAPGVTRAAAQAELAALTQRTATSPTIGEPEFFQRYTSARLSDVTGLPADVGGAIAGFFAVLLVIAGLVLLIAAVNVAGMLLARAVARRREIAVRIALGAGRGRLIRQLLTESVMLFAIGGAGGAWLAVYGTKLLERIELPADLPIGIDIAPDARVLIVTLAVALVTGIVFGLAPALHASRLDLSASMRGDSAGAGRSRSRMRNVLVIGQVAMSLLLLSAAGLFSRALDRGRRVDPGFDATHVATATLNVGAAGYNEARGRVFYRDLGARLASLPGVTAVGYSRYLPLSSTNAGTEIVIDGYLPPAGAGRAGDAVSVNLFDVDEGYFAAIRVPILAGRGILATDDQRAPSVAVVNQAFVRRYWGDKDAVGRTFRMDSSVVTVVGVVRDSKYARLDEPPRPLMYFPIAQRWRATMTILVRTEGSPASIGPAIVREMHALDPRLPAPAITTLEQAIQIVLLPQRVAASVTGVLGLAGLLLAAVGLYGVVSFSSAQRTREIGVRMALGAARTQVVRLVVGEGMRLVGIGMGIGLLLALLATRALTPFLFGVSPLDALTFAAIGVTLGGAAFVACYLPARRAARVDPVVTLRQE